jgi:NTP pyrophosphatase (non-canonical NTP hydrolase)
MTKAKSLFNVGFEYFDEDGSDRTDPNTYLAATPLEMVRQFSRIMGQSMDNRYVQNSKLDRMRLLLVQEEFDEVCAAENADNLLKELADLAYVTFGYAAAFGWDLDEAIRRVHASNMSKLGLDGKPVYRDDGKVMKSENYQAPDLSDLL